MYSSEYDVCDVTLSVYPHARYQIMRPLCIYYHSFLGIMRIITIEEISNCNNAHGP
jgi:hypothetical protein